MIQALRRHWPEYGMEAFGLAAFMVSACLFAMLLEHPLSPARSLFADAFTRRAFMGLAMGLTAVALVYCPWGKQSGAHLNPAVTIGFLRLGTIAPWDALFYAAAQTLGGVAGVLLARLLVGARLGDPPVRFVVTAPGRHGAWLAFAGEVLISFVLMTVVLELASRARLARYTGLAAGGLLAISIAFESPLSGTSLNPARTLASAWPSGIWTAFWVYASAPTLAMLLAVELHLRRTRGRERPCAKLHHQNTRRCIHCGAASGEEVLRSAERVARGSSRRKAAAVAALCLLLAAAAATARTVRATGPVGLTVSDLDRSVAFYTGVLGFEKVGERELSGPQHERLVGVFGAWVRVARLRLGEESIELTEYLAPRGRPAPADSRSNDRWFQHVAIVVSDLDRAVARLREHRVELASSGPQRLPDWNPKAGGIRAFYFRDPDRHPLEVIWFPPGKGAERWHRQGEQLFLGIDHTAIVVADTDASLAFYRDALGLTVAGESENWGIEQEHLNNVFGARLRITTLRAASGPGIELLEYLTPRDGRPMPADERASDLVHWETVLTASDLEGLAGRLADGDTAFVSPGLVRLPGSSPESAAVTVRDPDGHVLRIEGAGVATTANRAEEAQR